MRFQNAVLLLLALLGMLGPSPAPAAVPAGTPPDTFEKSEFAVVRDAEQDRSQVKAGEQFTLILRLTPYVAANYEFHLYDTQSGNPFPSNFVIDPVDGITFDINFPPGHEKTSPGGTTWELQGQQLITIVGKVDPGAAPGQRTINSKLQFMTCTDDMCLSPSEVADTWVIEVLPSDSKAVIDVTGLQTLTATTVPDPDRWSLPTTALDDAPGVDLSNMKPQGGEGLPLWKALLMALAGGLILNIMPCVLPVVSIKIISLARHAEEEPEVVKAQGLTFCLGIIATFLALALVINIVQAGGQQLGWGFQFQNPTFLVVMSTIIFAFALSLAGVFTIKPPSKLTEAGERLSEKEGLAGSFFKGVLATVLGTPCVGPFLGPALGYALTQGAFEVWAIFAAVGVGMALPYALLVANPRFLKMGQRERGKLTRSIQEKKNLLVNFERVMAFVLFATVLYLLNILGGSMGTQAVVWTLAFLLGVAFALWLWGELIKTGRRGIVLGLILAPAIMAASGLLALPNIAPPAINSTNSAQLNWVPFDPSVLAQELAAGNDVLIDFTADWCPNCKVNEAAALNTFETKKIMASNNIVAMKADWTATDPNITKMLRSLGYSSIPLTAIFKASSPSTPVLLDGIYTEARLHDELQ